ncbi:MAG: acyltransferase [Bacteroidota bacterium]
MESTEKKESKIAIVQTIRGLAALSVCLFHFKEGDLIKNFPKEELSGFMNVFLAIISKGWVGVEVFFVLSGFIIVYSMVKGNYQVADFFKFFSKRCLRIEPPYLLSIVVVLVLGYLSTKAPGFKGEPFVFDPLNILAHLGYLPEILGFKWLQPIYWSLEAEFHYYILIGLLLPFIWKSKYSLLISFSIGLISSFFIPLHAFKYMPFFIMGIAACSKKLGKINSPLFYGVLVASFAVCILRHQPLIMPIAGFLTALAILYVKWSNVVTEFLGKISYSLYLLHIPIGGRVINLAGRYADTEWKVWLSFLIALIVSLVSSWVFYKLVEYPSQLLSKKITYKKKSKVAVTVAV